MWYVLILVVTVVVLVVAWMCVQHKAKGKERICVHLPNTPSLESCVCHPPVASTVKMSYDHPKHSCHTPFPSLLVELLCPLGMRCNNLAFFFMLHDLATWAAWGEVQKFGGSCNEKNVFLNS